jgi:hypothetical protein
LKPFTCVLKKICCFLMGVFQMFDFVHNCGLLFIIPCGARNS